MMFDYLNNGHCSAITQVGRFYMVVKSALLVDKGPKSYSALLCGP
jgi:hypothetical protein